MPLIVIHDPWIYWLLAAVSFAGLFAFSYFVVHLMFFSLWVKRTRSVKELGWAIGHIVVSVPSMMFLLLSLLVYCVAAFLGHFEYVFIWYAIVAAIDVFASPLKLVYAHTNDALPPLVQSELLYIKLVMDAVIAALAVGATYLFLNAVVLA